MRGAQGGVRGALRGAGCWALSAVLGAACVVLSAGDGVLIAGDTVPHPERAVPGVASNSPSQAPPAAPAVLPDGDGVEVARGRCLVCHGPDLIVSQRLDGAGWGREVDKMIRWGAAVSATERPPLMAYLASHFAPAPAVAHARAQEGEPIFKRACLTCHGADMAESQRLSPIGWTREIEKMIRWGAKLTDGEKAALVDYLASRQPAR